MIPPSIRLTLRNLIVNTDPGTLLFLLGLPSFYLIVLGLMFQSIIPNVPFAGKDISYAQFLSPGVVAMQPFIAGSIGGSMLWSDRRWGMFEQLIVGPFHRIDYLLGIIYVSIIFSVGGAFLMFLVSYAITGFLVSYDINLLMIAVVLIVSSILFTSIFLVLSVFIRTIQTYNTVTMFVFFILDFASSAFYPINSRTPLGLRIVSYMNPLTYIVDAVRNMMFYKIGMQDYISLLIVVVLSGFFFLIALVSYGRARV
ncbi:ABC-2 integral membrane protein [Thermoplasma volcanium GSS1]|uniref:ABC-2 integral membrane protein n=1 Tax=Thermoplasma volcanium (strain ATCC 51530 / DSM 4299 / JCM 9571 / NBRC 15438 / GSS1) TaxID=273116 RepID=Q978M2_THEVO|nr:ABC transporter permease [Thermoplasma volcanium]BAB60535.1 ABC-2 integral membrane protein [Thermoplasma volcanium GSS1]